MKSEQRGVILLNYAEIKAELDNLYKLDYNSPYDDYILGQIDILEWVLEIDSKKSPIGNNASHELLNLLMRN